MKPTYEELEQQLAAVVAENAGLKGFGKTLSEMHEGLNGSGTGIQGEYEDTCQQVALDAAMDAFDEIKTPATDAFLAEVRAKGAELAGEYLKQYAQSVHEEARLVLQDAGELCNGFAAQLRQGAAL
ncbi:hypothetical protein [Pseudocitrobacter sp. MW920760]|uniref:hypothetical protein n=1 Tax=Pseudocitrobacter sp. MW920760 TaxID=2981140 RepID=UPI002E19BEF9|nr:hypothetical protein [Pseudocitrobacter sp. MW920760]